MIAPTSLQPNDRFRIHGRNCNVPDQKSPYYHHASRGHSANSLPRPPIVLQGKSRLGWPPSPFAEDEAISLSHEFQPVSTDISSDDEAQSRGSIDQLPLIIDAESTILRSNTDNLSHYIDCDTPSLKSKSSHESLGPFTPRDGSLDNPDRRYVFIPQKGIEIPLTYDEPRSSPYAQNSREENQHYNRPRRKEIPALNTSTSKSQVIDEMDLPVYARREPSPYAYTANSGKSTFSGDYPLSPGYTSPKTSYASSPRNVRDGRILHPGNELKPEKTHDAACSRSPSPGAERPNIERHTSAVKYPGEPIMFNSSRSARRRYSSTSGDSGTDSDDSRNRSRRERGSRQSAPRFDRLKEAPIPLRNVTPKSEEGTPATFSRPASPIAQPRLNPVYGKTFPPQPPVYREPAVLTRGSTMDGTAMSRPPLPPRRSNLPYPSPPSSPFLEKRKDPGYASTVRRSRPNSRPASPTSQSLHYSQPTGSAPPIDPDYETRRSSNTLRSRRGSPLPSPDFVHISNGFSYTINTEDPPIDWANKTPIKPPALPLRPQSAQSPVAIPVSSSSSLRPKIADNGKRTLSSLDARPPIPVDAHAIRRASNFPSPQQWQPPVQSLPVPQSPQTKKKRLILPPCPRPDYVRGYDDWHTLLGNGDFDICPTCRAAVVDAGYGHHFRPAPSRPHDYETKCDFSNAWVRMAWLLTLRENIPHVNLLYSLAEIIGRETVCPGKDGAVRTWYRLYDPETRREVSNFDVCPACVGSLESIFPILRGIFVPAQMTNPFEKRRCDLRSDSRRFASYTDLLEETANQSVQHRRPPDMYRFVSLARRLASMRECSRDDMIVGEAWHIIPHLPEFSVCEECFEQVVRPHIHKGSLVAGQFNRSLQLLHAGEGGDGGDSCQLYSERMRDVFGEMCRRNDFAGLQTAVLQRWKVERDLQRRMRELTERVSVAKRRGLGGEKGNVGEEMEMLVQEWKRWE